MNHISPAGLRILQTLDKLGQSQNWLIKQAHLGSSTLNAFIKGKRGLNLSTAIRIADALGVSLDWLYLGR